MSIKFNQIFWPNYNWSTEVCLSLRNFKQLELLKSLLSDLTHILKLNFNNTRKRYEYTGEKVKQ